MSKEQPWWRKWLGQGKGLEEVTKEFLKRQIGEEPTQEQLVASHEADLSRWRRMSRAELKQQLFNNEILADAIARTQNCQEGGNVSHVQWRINTLRSLLDREAEG